MIDKVKQTDWFERTEHSTEAKEYYLLPTYCLAIPVHEAMTAETLSTVLAEFGDWDSSNCLDDYPIVNAHHLRLHFDWYDVVPVLKFVRVTKPRNCFSGYEAGLVEDRKKIEADHRAYRLKQERRVELESRTKDVDF